MKNAIFPTRFRDDSIGCNTSHNSVRLIRFAVPHTDAFDWFGHLWSIVALFLHIVPLTELGIHQIKHGLIADLVPVLLEDVHRKWFHARPNPRSCLTGADGWSAQHLIALFDGLVQRR